MCLRQDPTLMCKNHLNFHITCKITMIFVIGGLGNSTTYFSFFVRECVRRCFPRVHTVFIEDAASVDRHLLEVPERERVLVGFSLGAAAALEVSSRIPVQRLIMIAPVSYYDVLYDHNGIEETDASYAPLRSRWWKDLRLVSVCVHVAQAIPWFRGWLRKLYLRFNPECPDTVLNTIFSNNLVKQHDIVRKYVTNFNIFAAIKNARAQRTEIICGTRDEFGPFARFLQSYNETIRVRFCEGDHHLILHCPELLCDMLESAVI